MTKTSPYLSFITFICWLWLPLITQAQPDKALDSSPPLNIEASIAEQSKSLRALQDLLDNRKALPDIQALLQQLPVTEDNLLAKTLTLSGETISARRIAAVVQLSEKISQAAKQHQSYLQTLEAAIEQLDDTKQQLLSLQQLLNNPVNQVDAAEQHQKLSQLLTKVSNLSIVFPQVVEQEQLEIEQSHNAVGLLHAWQNSLFRSLDEPNSTVQVASNQENIEQQLKQYETELIYLSTKLSKQRNKLSLTEIKELKTQIYLKQSHLWLVSVDNDLLQWTQGVPTLLPIEHKGFGDNIQPQKLLTKVRHILPLIKEKIAAVQARQAAFQNYQAVIGSQPDLEDDFKQRLQLLTFQQLQLSDMQQQLQNQLTLSNQHSLFVRQELWQRGGFAEVLNKLPNALVQVGFQVQISIKQFAQQVLAKPWQIVPIAVVALLILFLIRVSADFNLSRTLLKHSNRNGLVAMLRKIFFVIQKRAYSLILLGVVVALVRFSDLPSPSDHIIRILVYTLAILIVWFSLSSLEVKLGVVDRVATRRSNINVVILALLVFVYALSKLSRVADSITNLYEKVLLLGIIAVAWSVHKYLKVALRKEQQPLDSRTYRLYLTTIKVAPSVVIALCLLGFIGFANLAWLLLGYVGILLIYCTVVTLGILLFNSTRKTLKLASLKQFEHGLFIAQDIVNPLSTITKAAWIVLCSLLLVAVIGNWYGSNTFLVSKSLEWLNMPLFSIGDNALSVFALSLLAASPFIIFRVAKWLRMFSFHWLFAGINDIGIRHSLSIFSQYVVALIGVLTTLKIVGVDLTSFAVFAGALGVGVGLGLQDIAKNFISGILLLIERPLRSGDWIAIDGSEGTVKSIGMRAITMETFDKQEVIIPNGNAINNSFTNYTHSNNITRTVLYVGASYACNPDQVTAVLDKVLDHIEAVLKQPKWQVLVWEYADSAINYRIQYYIDLEKNRRLATKNLVLKAIWHEFKANAIEMPFPQRDVYLKTAIPESENQ